MALAGVPAVDMVVAMAVDTALAVDMALAMKLAVDTALAVDMAVDIALDMDLALVMAVDTALASVATDHFATEDAIPLATNHHYRSSLACNDLSKVKFN